MALAPPPLPRAALSVALAGLTIFAGLLNAPRAPEIPREVAWAEAEAVARSVSLEGITLNLAGANAASVAELLDSLPGGALQPALSRKTIEGTLSVSSSAEVPPPLARRALEAGLATMAASGCDARVVIGPAGSTAGALPERAAVFRDLEAGIEILSYPACVEAKRTRTVKHRTRRARERGPLRTPR